MKQLELHFNWLNLIAGSSPASLAKLFGNPSNSGGSGGIGRRECFRDALCIKGEVSSPVRAERKKPNTSILTVRSLNNEVQQKLPRLMLFDRKAHGSLSGD
jgi:hypothetical protein